MNPELKDWLNSINYKKNNLFDDPEVTDSMYPAFIVNRCMAGHMDAVLYANEMNRYHFLDNKLQYEFYLNSIRKKKRFAKWAKADNNDELNMISEYYKISLPKAKDALKILSPEQKQDIRNKLEQGIKND